MVMSDRAQFDLALRLRSAEGAPLGEVFSFMSGLYFRGKLAYARAFAQPPDPDASPSTSGIFVITPTAGLRSPDTRVTREALRAFAGVDVAADNPRYRRPLEASARALGDEVGPDCEVVLLGSIASSKYVQVLEAVLRQPPAVSGRLRRPRRHEPRRPDAPVGQRRARASLHPCRRRRASRHPPATPRAALEGLARVLSQAGKPRRFDLLIACRTRSRVTPPSE